MHVIIGAHCHEMLYVCILLVYAVLVYLAILVSSWCVSDNWVFFGAQEHLNFKNAILPKQISMFNENLAVFCIIFRQNAMEVLRKIGLK